jgi:hypothetical protein
VTNKQFKAGTKAYCDAFRHILECKVLEVIEPGNGRICGSGKLKIEITATNGPYPKGEILERDGYSVFPKAMRINKPITFRINPNYEWIK